VLILLKVIGERKGVFNMRREEVYKDIEGMFGFVPSFFKAVPDSSLDLEWKLMKRVQFDEGPIPNKYRELIGLGIAAVMKCRYCTLFHTEIAKLNGASDAEIEDAVHFAKSSAGWSTYLNGLQIDYNEFKEEVKRAVDYVRSKQGPEKELRCRDVGPDCDHVIRGRSEDEIFAKAAEHARLAHQIMEIPPELMEKARAAIHTVTA
jgi:AhpD family alkylhydroperoxidase